MNTTMGFEVRGWRWLVGNPRTIPMVTLDCFKCKRATEIYIGRTKESWLNGYHCCPVCGKNNNHYISHQQIRLSKTEDRVPYWKIYCSSCGCLGEYRRYAKHGSYKEACDVCGGYPLIGMYEQVSTGVVVTWGDERI